MGGQRSCRRPLRAQNVKRVPFIIFVNIRYKWEVKMQKCYQIALKYKKYGQKGPLRGHYETIAEVTDLQFQNFKNL